MAKILSRLLSSKWLTSILTDHFIDVISIRIIVMEHLILVTENIVVHVVLLGWLGHEYKRLHEASHWLPIVWQLSGHLWQKNLLNVFPLTLSVEKRMQFFRKSCWKYSPAQPLHCPQLLDCLPVVFWHDNRGNSASKFFCEYPVNKQKNANQQVYNNSP